MAGSDFDVEAPEKEISWEQTAVGRTCPDNG